jgi:hypothetical protein
MAASAPASGRFPTFILDSSRRAENNNYNKQQDVKKSCKRATSLIILALFLPTQLSFLLGALLLSIPVLLFFVLVFPL